jgi:hypothetical protein
MSRKIMKKAFRLYKKPFLRMPKKGRCPSCQAISTNRICPRCHSQLPNDIDKVDSMIIAVIGAKNAGKSHYITVLIQELKNQLSADFNFAIRALTDKTSDRYDKYFRRPVYEENRVIDATQTALVDRSVMEPLIYELKFHRSVTNLKTKKIVDLIFF